MTAAVQPLLKMMSPSFDTCTMRKADCAVWDTFVNECNEATFFHLSGWKEVIERAFGHRTYYLFVERDHKIEGILPLVHIRSRLFGNSLSSLPFCVSGGVATTNEAARTVLEQQAKDLAKTLDVDYLECRNTTRRCLDWPCKNLYVTFRKELDPNVETNLKNIPRKQRAMVRKGIKNGLVSEIDNHELRFYEAYARSLHALGTPVYSKKYFQILKSVFKDQCEILTITWQGQLISSVMSFYFRDQVLPYYGGGMSQARALKGNDFMYWELMRRACERGIRIFDYGRSKEGTGSYSFKKNWGFEPESLYYEYFLVRAKEVPDLSPMNKKYRSLIGLWKKMPYRMTKIIGPHIVKYLG